MMINKFLKNKIKNIKTSNRKYKNYIVREAYMMNKFNVNDEKSLLRFHYISQYVPIFVKCVYGSYDNKLMSDVFSYVMLDSSNVNCSNDIKDKVAEYFSRSNIIKTAYPNYGSDNDPIKKYDMMKWKTALNDITIRAKLYGNKKDAIDYITRNWSDMDEKRDFGNWAKDKENGVGNLYRIALFEEKVGLELQHIPGFMSKKPVIDESVKQEKTRDEIIKQKVLGRIHSVKKMLSTKDGPHLLGNNYSKIMKSILDLEGDILGVRTASMIQDIILRTGGYLEQEGCDKTVVKALYKMAQMPSLDDIPVGDDMSGMPSAPGEGGDKEEPSGDSEEGVKAIDEFVRRVRGYGTEEMVPENIKDKFDGIKEKLEDNLDSKASWYNIETKEVKALENLTGDIFKVASLLIFANRDKLNKIAQEATPAIENMAPAPPPSPAPPLLDNTPKEPKDTLDEAPAPPIDSENLLENKSKEDIDTLFAGIKVSDVVKRLEALSRVFQNREIARQLSIIDLMLDSLGISGFFPSLAEATKSALESNQYCQSRVEEVLSRLVSSVNTSGASVIDSDKLEPKSRKQTDSLIDKEMEQYLNEDVQQVENAPKPVAEKAENAAIPDQTEAPTIEPEEVPIAPAV